MFSKFIHLKIVRIIIPVISVVFGALFVVHLIDIIKTAIIEKDQHQEMVEQQKDNLLQIPEGLEEYLSDTDTEWTAGMRVLLLNCTEAESEAAENIDTYEFAEGIIKASVELVNPLNRKQYFSLIVLADGFPQQFRLGEYFYDQYYFYLTDRKTIEIEIEPSFYSNAGRLDFLLIYQESVKCDYTMMSYTICIKQKESISFSKSTVKTVPVRKELRNAATGDVFLSWLSKEGNYNPGKREVSFRPDESMLLEAVTGRSCYHALLFYYNGQVIPVKNHEQEKILLYWKSDPETMIQEKVIFDYGKGGYFSVFLIPINDFSKTTERSYIIQLSETEDIGGKGRE